VTHPGGPFGREAPIPAPSRAAGGFFAIDIHPAILLLDQGAGQELEVAKDPAELPVFNLGHQRGHHQNQAKGYRDADLTGLILGQRNTARAGVHGPVQYLF